MTSRSESRRTHEKENSTVGADTKMEKKYVFPDTDLLRREMPYHRTRSSPGGWFGFSKFMKNVQFPSFSREMTVPHASERGKSPLSELF